ncbi:MAG: hypothetical protein DCC71_03925 [Proteobacteria bacterium]|nr:MAG: hypothetical protein DCC71_03925 [Pseudomonadota bacterium]
MRRSLIALLSFAVAAAAAAQTPAPVAAVAVPGAGPIADEAAFAKAPPASVKLFPQVLTTPHGPATPSIGQVTVRAVRNRDHAGFLLEWDDATEDARTAVTAFGDMAAVAFPAQAPGKPLPAPFMGNAGGRVQILQWRADWQTDLVRGPITVAELYPNTYASDYRPEDHLPKAAGDRYRGGVAAGNPMSAVHTSSVQDLMAEGFGSLTPRAKQQAQGHARHDGSGWHVVITRPLAADGDSAPSLAAGTTTQLALAVWDGAKGEVGARKAWAGWIPLEIAR